MKISLIICTRNRAEQLRRCLASVERLTCRHTWELIIVDNGSSDGTAGVVREFASTVDFDVNLVHEPRPGLGRAHNAGVAIAGGEIIAFTDDDCYTEPDFLEQIVKVFEDPAISYMGGRILLYDATDARCSIRTDTHVTRIPPGSFIPTGLIQGANMAARRSVIDSLGGFDPMLGPGTAFNCEDVDFVARASAAGFAGGYFPGPVVYHHHGRKPGKTIDDLMQTYTFGGGAYYAKFLLHGSTRGLHARHWWWRAKSQSIRVTAMEIRGAVHYTCLRAWQWLHFGRESLRETPALTHRDGMSFNQKP